MLKHQEIINNLTVEQKLALLVNNRTEPISQNGAKLPSFSLGTLKHVNETWDDVSYPSLATLSRSWNLDLINEASADLATRAKRNGASVVKTPECGLVSHPYREGFTEDPYFGGNVLAACAGGVVRAGVTPFFSKCALTSTDASYLDVVPDEAVLRDYLIKPFEIASNAVGCGAVLTDYVQLNGSYRAVNTDTVADILHEQGFRGKAIVCENTTAETSVLSLLRGNLCCLDGNVYPLESAYRNYIRMQAAVEEGTLSAAELDAACIEGLALSDETIDAAIDRLLGFYAECEDRAAYIHNTVANAEDTALEASRQSVVLLKNDRHILPFGTKTRVAVIGQHAVQSEHEGTPTLLEMLEALAENAPFQYVGYADGYSISEDRSDGLIPSARSLAMTADAVVLCLGLDADRAACLEWTHQLKLPANQLALIDELSALGKDIVAIITTERAIDVSFAGACSALLLAPDRGTYRSAALLDVLSGLTNPSGKLALSLHAEADVRLRIGKQRKDAERIKIGAFFGYREYDAQKQTTIFPFGYGLSYTTFAYSVLKADYKGVRFRVKNTGRRAGFEIAQVYLGMKESAMARPPKELKAFAKIYLNPGESRIVTLGFDQEDFLVFDSVDRKRKTEQGIYTAYVGASVSDIRLEQSFRVFGDKIAEIGALSDYVQTESNIVTGRYVMDVTENYPQKKSKTKAVSLTVIILALLCDIGIIVLGSVAAVQGWTVQPFAPDTIYFLLTVAALCVVNLPLVIAVVALILYANKLKRQRLRIDPIMANAAPRNEVSVSTELPLEQLFLIEFGDDEDELVEDVLEEVDLFDDHSSYIDKSLNLPMVASQLALFCDERGLALGNGAARTLLAAMSASRFLVLRGGEPSLLTELTVCLADFFGSPKFQDTLMNESGSVDDLLCKSDEYGRFMATALTGAMNAGNEEPYKMHLATLFNFRPELDGPCFMPFVSYLASPGRACRIGFKNKNISNATYTVPSNLWMILQLAQGETVDRLPSYIAEHAAVVSVKIQRSVGRAQKTPMKQISYYQFERFGTDVVQEYALSESMWKKLDKLELFANTHGGYRIGNKAWQRIEKFTAVCLACNGTESEALDAVIASKLLPTMLLQLKENMTRDENDFGQTLEKILGEDNANVSLEAVKLSSYTTAV